jgi:putative transposase
MSEGFRVHDGTLAHFITSAVTYWIPIFSREDYFAILADSLTYCAEEKGLLIHGYVLMPNHFHLLATQEEGLLSDVMRDMKGYTSRKIAKKLREDGRDIWLRAFTRKDDSGSHVQIWQEDFHPEEARTQRFFDQKLNYIHQNPIRAGFVEEAIHWKYSSAGFYYADMPSRVPVTPVPW